jgi:hypothetical protein
MEWTRFSKTSTNQLMTALFSAKDENKSED